MDENNPDRRPIAARKTSPAKSLTLWLASTGITPNTISIIGMICGILAGVAFALTQNPIIGRWMFLVAAAMMPLRLLANLMDGMVAVESGQSSPTGELFNDIPDRVSDAAMFIGAGYALGSDPALGFTAAVLAVFIAYVRIEGKNAGAHMEFCGPLAKAERVYCMIAIALACLIVPDLGILKYGLLVIIVGEIWTAIRRISRIAVNLRGQSS